MRKPSPTDFTVPMPGEGDFVFGRRTLGDSIAIRSEFVHLFGPDGGADAEIGLFGGFVAAYRVLMVSCPAGWEDLLALDDTNGDAAAKVIELHALLRAKEESFRLPKVEEGEA